MTNISDTNDLGTQLRFARKYLGLTQPQLALATGVGVRFIVDLEAGKPTVQLGLVLRVIDALGGNLTISGLPDMPTALGASAPHSSGSGSGTDTDTDTDTDATVTTSTEAGLNKINANRKNTDG